MVTPKGLFGSFEVLREIIERIERDRAYRAVYTGEPQLGKRGLYPTLSRRGNVRSDVALLRNVLAYADSDMDTTAMSALFGVSVPEVQKAVATLVAAGLLVEC